MSEQQPVAPAQKPNAIQMIETELVNFLRQKEQAIANLHAIDGAIQAAQAFLNKLRAEAAKAEAEAKKLATETVAEVEKVAETVATDVKTEAEKVEAKVVSIAEAAKKEL